MVALHESDRWFTLQLLLDGDVRQSCAYCLPAPAVFSFAMCHSQLERRWFLAFQQAHFWNILTGYCKYLLCSSGSISHLVVH